MIVGNPAEFALESEITAAYRRLNFRGLGFFQIHLGGFAYGIREPDATMLARSFDEVECRISRRGLHLAPLPIDVPSEALARAFSAVLYDDAEPAEALGMPSSQLRHAVHQNHHQWAPDGDEAFDDGSLIFQMDYGNSVRLISYRQTSQYVPELGTLRDVVLDAATFYEILAEWHKAFAAHWMAAPKDD